MADRAELAHLPKQSADVRGARTPSTPTRNERCLGAAAQLAVVHRVLRHGPALELETRGAAAPARAPADNRTGLPDRLKSGIEALSGISLNGVKVHYNSSKPAQLDALAYAQGGDIHLAPGQEKHLPHEAWHVVQQVGGRVKPTVQLKGGAAVNDDAGLEREAEAMGRLANRRPISLSEGPATPGPPVLPWAPVTGSRAAIQRVLKQSDEQAFADWRGQHDLRLTGPQLERITLDAANFDEAKQLALDLSARFFSNRKKTLLEKDLKLAKKVLGKAASKKEAEELEEKITIITNMIADLERGGLGRSLPAAVASLAELLMDSYPPEAFSYVMMGNSPAPLLAWMHLNGRIGAAFHLPLGGLTSEKGAKRMGQFGGEDRQKVASYLDVALAAALERGKPLVLVDYASTGGSLAVTASLLKQWLENRQPVFIFGYSEEPLEKLDKLKSGGHAGILATSMGEMEKVFTEMNAKKIVKDGLLLKGPASLDILDLLDAPKGAARVVAHPDHWARVLRLMNTELQNALLYDD